MINQIQNLTSASLLTLAVVSRPGLSVTLEDMARLFNSEVLPWHNAGMFLPQHYSLNLSTEVQESMTFDHHFLSIKTWRLATYLSDVKEKNRTTDQKRIVLLNHDIKLGNDLDKSQFAQVRFCDISNFKESIDIDSFRL